jgi:hypothetical protein
MQQHLNKTNNLAAQQGKSKLSSLFILLVLMVAVGGVFTNYNRIFDYIQLRNYQPPANIVQLADDTTMNAAARHLLYLNKPKLANIVADFRKHCPENEDTIVLGCYHSTERGIFVYNVPDAELAGVQQVTIAHETLHAAYDRLSNHDKTTINKALNDFYDNQLTDPEVKAEIAIYKRTEPSQVTNEMHSIFGTEVAKLPGPLESYYKRYFNDRSKITDYAQRYRSQFSQRQAAITAADAQLDILKKTIDSQQTDLNAQLVQINAERARINGYANANDNTKYNAAVPGFNAMIDSYNNNVARLKDVIATYNSLVATHNQIASQLSVLNKALDTRTTTSVNN